jgi:hypothetical protein
MSIIFLNKTLENIANGECMTFQEEKFCNLNNSRSIVSVSVACKPTRVLKVTNNILIQHTDGETSWK